MRARHFALCLSALLAVGALLAAPGMKSAGAATSRRAVPGKTAARAPTPQQAARRILAERRFRAVSVPRPLHGLLSRLGKLVKALTHPLVKLVREVGRHLLGGSATVWSVLGLLILGGATLATSRLVRRRTPAAGEATRTRTEPSDDPTRLDREALSAEADGHLDLAVRLRFRAGLLRLNDVRAIDLRPSLTTGEVARQLDSRRFDELARAFDEIAYAPREADEADLRLARSGWPELLEEVGRR